MTNAEIMYAVHCLEIVAMLMFSWQRSRSILHPHFMFTVMLCVFMSDFIVRGYDDQNWQFISESNIHFYQLIILAVFGALVLLAAAIRDPRIEATVPTAWQPQLTSAESMKVIAFVAWTVLAAEIFKRLYEVGWSPGAVLTQMLGPRGERDWDQAQYTGNFVYAIISILMPLSVTAFAYLAVNAKQVERMFGIVGFAIGFAILVTDASRTPVAITLGALAMFLMMRGGSRIWKVAMLSGMAVIGAGLMSAILLARGAGFVDETGQPTEFQFYYHQDDSYYRTISAYDVAGRVDYAWDPLEFMGAIVANPIPRMFWPEKPALDQDFYGEYKLYYVTTLFTGEIVAMAGTLFAPLVSILVGLVIYWGFYRSVVLLKYPLGIVAYILVAAYVYMVMRSLMNVTMYVYLPAAAIAIVLALAQLQARGIQPDPGPAEAT